MPPEQRRIGYVFQDGRLFPHMSVVRNLRYGLERTRARQQTVGFDQIVALLGLETLLVERSPEALLDRLAAHRHQLPDKWIDRGQAVPNTRSPASPKPGRM